MFVYLFFFLSLTTSIIAQLFPFSTLHQYIDPKTVQAGHVQASTESNLIERPYRQLTTNEEIEKSTELALTRSISNEYHYRNEPSRPKVIINSPTVDAKTVLVTPRPKYRPQMYVREPALDANHPRVPAMDFIAIGNKPVGVEVVPDFKVLGDIFKPGGLNLIYNRTARNKIPGATLVENIPSLSVVIPIDAKPRNVDGLPDYLIPPQYPSVYDTSEHQSENLIQENFNIIKPDNDIKSEKNLITIKPLKSNNFHKIRNDTVLEIIKGKKKLRGRFRKPDTEKKTQKRKVSPPSQKGTFFNSVDSQYDQDESGIYYGNNFEDNAKNGKFINYRENDNFQPTSSEIKSNENYVNQNYGRVIQEQMSSESGFPFKIDHSSLESSGNQRIEFQMHGQNGPESYKFGYDTGKGYNRQFRFEEKDHKGHVIGHYGYYDKSGKLQVVNYHADENGFHAQPVEHSK